MLRHGVIATLVLVNSFVFTATLSAQMSSVEGSVVGADGRPLKDAEIRFEQKEGQVSAIISRTDANGRYAAALPRGTYKLSLATDGKVKASITVRATGAKSRIVVQYEMLDWMTTHGIAALTTLSLPGVERQFLDRSGRVIQRFP